MSYVRSAPRALIVEEGQLLTVVLQHGQKEAFHVLPGGGQLYGETLHESLKRECREELGVEIEIGEVAYVREYIGEHHEFKSIHQGFHQLEVVFRCCIAEGARINDSIIGDRGQIGVEWVPLDELTKKTIYPAQLAEMVSHNDLCIPALYLGDIN